MKKLVKVVASTNNFRLNKISADFFDSLQRLGFKSVSPNDEAMAALSVDGKDVLFYDLNSGSLIRYTNAALSDGGESFLKASMDDVILQDFYVAHPEIEAQHVQDEADVLYGM